MKIIYLQKNSLARVLVTLKLHFTRYFNSVKIIFNLNLPQEEYMSESMLEKKIGYFD